MQQHRLAASALEAPMPPSAQCNYTTRTFETMQQNRLAASALEAPMPPTAECNSTTIALEALTPPRAKCEPGDMQTLQTLHQEVDKRQSFKQRIGPRSGVCCSITPDTAADPRGPDDQTLAACLSISGGCYSNTPEPVLGHRDPDDEATPTQQTSDYNGTMPTLSMQHNRLVANTPGVPTTPPAECNATNMEKIGTTVRTEINCGEDGTTGEATGRRPVASGAVGGYSLSQHPAATATTAISRLLAEQRINCLMRQQLTQMHESMQRPTKQNQELHERLQASEAHRADTASAAPPPPGPSSKDHIDHCLDKARNQHSSAAHSDVTWYRLDDTPEESSCTPEGQEGHPSLNSIYESDWFDVEAVIDSIFADISRDGVFASGSTEGMRLDSHAQDSKCRDRHTQLGLVGGRSNEETNTRVADAAKVQNTVAARAKYAPAPLRNTLCCDISDEDPVTQERALRTKSYVSQDSSQTSTTPQQSPRWCSRELPS